MGIGDGFTPTMKAALERMKLGGGVLERRNGGFWMPPGQKHVPYQDDYVVTQTVQALENRGVVAIEWTAKPVRAVLRAQQGA